jgi:hypothetical protein
MYQNGPTILANIRIKGSYRGTVGMFGSKKNGFEFSFSILLLLSSRVIKYDG